MIREPIGHEAVRGMLRSISGSGAALPHAWLFAGPSGVGKFQTARWWASLLKCEQGGIRDPLCSSCRLVAGGVHPDVLESGPAPKDKNAHQKVGEKTELKKSIGVEDSRALIHRLSLKATKPGPRVAIVREAGLMTAEAQNALLKLLEEPPGSAVIVLVADNAGSMLATVRSRCRHLAFGELGEREVVEVLLRLGWAEEDAAAAAACSRGSIARALGFDADGLAEREQLLLAWEQVKSNPAAIESVVQALVARKDDGYALFDLLEWQLAKVETALGHSAREPSSELAAILERTKEADSHAILKDAERIQHAIDALARNANARLVIRDLLMNVGA